MFFSLNTWNLATVLELKKRKKNNKKPTKNPHKITPKVGEEKKKRKVIYFAITLVTFFFI